MKSFHGKCFETKESNSPLRVTLNGNLKVNKSRAYYAVHSDAEMLETVVLKELRDELMVSAGSPSKSNIMTDWPASICSTSNKNSSTNLKYSGDICPKQCLVNTVVSSLDFEAALSLDTTGPLKKLAMILGLPVTI